MSHSSNDKLEFWIRFVCGFLFFGSICVLLGLRFVDSLGVLETVCMCVLTTFAMSFYVARVGDGGWRNLLGFLKWW